jgi:predicted unusual protein kinase regulating ubiquinone biosynthesis (AarF/ABC1/UbiB family)
MEDLLLTPADARRLAERLSRMRGAVMKLGQLMSLDGKDLLPPAFVELLAPLRDGAHVMPFSQLVGVLEREYGAGWDKRFRRFAFTPIAAASIGQVHRAETRDGRILALKIQYPGVRESIDSDIDNLALLARLPGLVPAGVDLAPVLAQVRAQLHREADYAAEARALGDYRALLGDDPLLSVPQVHSDLSTGRVLAMDLAEGVSVDRLAVPGRSQALRDRVAEALSRLVLRELFELGLVQTDPNFANYLFDEAGGRLHLLDFGAARSVDPTLARAYSRLARATMAEDRHAVRRAAEALGYLGAEDPGDSAEGLVDLILLASEPLRHRGLYDFGASGLLGRAHALGRELVFGRGFARTPPPETLFLHRKFVGAFMLCARLGARMDVRGLVEPWLDASLGGLSGDSCASAPSTLAGAAD